MIKVLKYVYAILESSTGITSIVGDKIFPDIVPDVDIDENQIDYPLIVTKRSAINPDNTKCVINNDTATVEIICYSISYLNVVDLAQEVRDKLDFYKGTVDGKKITHVRMNGITEGFTEGVYYQLLTFSIK